MDFDNDENTPFFASEVSWNWQDMDCSLPQEPHFQYAISPWTDDTTNLEDMSYISNDTNATPVKACVDIQWKDPESENLMKEYEESGVSSSQAKRRRVLKFNDEPIEFPLCTEDLSSDYPKIKAREESMESLVPEISPWDRTSSEFVPASNLEMTESDHWLAELLNDTDMNLEDMTLSAESDFQFSLSDFCGIQPSHETPPIQICKPPAPKPAPKTLSGKVIFKGRTSYIMTPVKLASSVAYPFTFIKPCPEKGGVTLQDINRKIHGPPREHNPHPPNLPKSAISGKLVVGKTRIRTEGGKGSITITRTRG